MALAMMSVTGSHGVHATEHHYDEAPQATPGQVPTCPDGGKACGAQGCAAGACKPQPRRFPTSLVWTPIPFISWLYPPVGHLGIADSAGVIHDFAGPYFVEIDSFAFGAPARFIQLDPGFIAAGEPGPTGSAAEHWDAHLRSATHVYQGLNYNILGNNCHAFVAYTLNAMAYKGRRDQNMIMLAALMFLSGRFVPAGNDSGGRSAGATFMPFVAISVVFLYFFGLTYLYAWLGGAGLMLSWFAYVVCRDSPSRVACPRSKPAPSPI